MLFRQLLDAESSTYSYLLASQGEAVLIDPVFEQHERDAALVRELGLSLKATIETHVHADHVTGAARAAERLGSAIVLGRHSGAEGADRLVGEGARVAFGDRALLVRETPGHTDGCITLVLDDRTMAFTGDCLMIRAAGRTDFQQGDAHRMFRSIRDVIFGLPDDCLLYPAHDYRGRTVTTVAEERAYNPRVGGEANERDFVDYMENLGLPHPKKIDIAVPANLRCGRAETPSAPPADWGPVRISFAGIPEIDPEWVAEHRGDVRILDVRRPEELVDPEIGALEDALTIPLGELADRVAEVPDDRPVVAICRSGRRSAQATEILRRAGRTRIANVSGGMLRWRELGL
ncbi:MAG: MBL fold metallo-hydrolase [Sandaracinaceae bacterium]